MSDLAKTIKDWAASAGLIDKESDASSGAQQAKAAPEATRRNNDVKRGVATYQKEGEGGAAKRVTDVIRQHKKELDDL